MSQNVPALAVLVLLCAPGLVWSEEPRPTNVPHSGSIYHGAGTGVMQDRRTRSPANTMPVHSISNHQNAHLSEPETFHNLRSNYRGEFQQIPTYVVRTPQTTSHKTILPLGSSPKVLDGSNPSRINSRFRVGATNPMISSVASAAELSVPSSSPILAREESMKKIPIYVIRPRFPGMASSTLVNMAVLPQEQINPDIIRILQSLRLSQDKVPVILVTGLLPSLTIDTQNVAEPGINTLDINAQDPSPGGHKTPMTNMTSPGKEWDDEEIMKHKTLIHGRRPPTIPNFGRFAPVSFQIYGKPEVPPPAYLHPAYPDPKHQNLFPMNTERLVVPGEINSPVYFFPSQQHTLPKVGVPGDVQTDNNYPPQKPQNYPLDLRQLNPEGSSDGLMYEPVQQTRIAKYPFEHGQESPYSSETPNKSFPDHLTQLPQFHERLVPNLPQNPDYVPPDDHGHTIVGLQYLPVPSSGAQEPRNFPYPSQEHPYSSQYNDQLPYDLQAKPNPEFPTSPGRVPPIKDQTDVLSQIERLKIPQSPSIHHNNFTGYRLPKQRYPGPQPLYPFIQRISSDQEEPSYPYSNDVRPHSTPQHGYPQNLLVDSDDLSNYPDPHVHSSQPPHFPTTIRSPDYPYHPSPQNASPDGKQPPMQPSPNIRAWIEKPIIPEKQQQMYAEPYSKYPASRAVPSDYHRSVPYQIYPDHDPTYPSDRLIPFSHLILPSLSVHPISDHVKPNMQYRPEIPAQIEKINIPEPHLGPQVRFSPNTPKQVRHPTPYSERTFPLQDIQGEQPQYLSDSLGPGYSNQVPQKEPQYPSSGYDEPTSRTYTPGLASDDKHPSTRPRPEVLLEMKEFDMPEKLHPRFQHHYLQYPSSGRGELTNYSDRSPDRHNQYPDYPSHDQVVDHPKQSSDNDRPSLRPTIAVRGGIAKLTGLEPLSVKPQQKYPRFLSAGNDEQIYYPDRGSQQPYELPQPDYPSDGRNTGQPRQSKDETEPQMRPRPVVSNNEEFSIPTYLKPRPKYPFIPSSETDEPIYYPDSATEVPNRRQQPNSPSKGYVADYPQHPTDGKEPQIRPISDETPNMEVLSRNEQPHPKPHQKYPLIPFSETNEPTYHPDNVPQRPYRGKHPDYSSDAQVSGYLQDPRDDTQPQVRSRPDNVSTIEKFSLPEQSFTNPQQLYPYVSSSDTGKPTYYPDSVPQQPYRGQHPNYPSDEQVAGYEVYPTDDTQPQMRPRPEPVSTVENFNISEQSYKQPQPLYPSRPSSDTDEPTYYPDSGSQPPYEGQHSAFSSDDQVAGYPTHPISGKVPKMKPRPGVVSSMEKFSIPERPYLKQLQKYPLIPSLETVEPTYYLDDSPQQLYKGQHPDYLSEDQVVGYPIQPRMRQTPDTAPNMEVISIPEQPFPKHQQIPSSDTDEPTYYPDSTQQQLHKGHRADYPFEGQEGYPEFPTDDKEPKMRLVSATDKFHIPDQSFQKPNKKNPQIPPSDVHESSFYPDGPSQELHRRKYPDYPSYGQVLGRPALPILGDRAPQMEPRPDVISRMEKFSIPVQPYQNPLQKYPLIPSSDTNDQTYYPASSPQRPYKGEAEDSPSEGQVIDYPEYLIGGQEPQMRHRPDVASNTEKFSIPEQAYLKPPQKYPLIPSSETDELTYYPDSSPQKPHRGQHPDLPSEDQVVDNPNFPTEGTETRMRPPPYVVSKMEIISKTEQPYQKLHQKYPLIPLPESNEPTNYLDSAPQNPHGGQHSDFPFIGQVVYYPQHPTNGTESQMMPTPDVVPSMEIISTTGQPYLKLQQKYPLVPPSETDELTHYPDSSPQKPHRGQHPDLPSEGQVVDNPPFPTEGTETRMRPPPYVVSKMEIISTTEQPYQELHKKYPLIPLPESNEPTNYLSAPQNPHRGQHSDFPFIGQVVYYPQLPTNGTESQMMPTPDVVPSMEIINTSGQPYLKLQQKYPLVPPSETGDPIFYPDGSPQQPYSGMPLDSPSTDQFVDYPQHLTDDTEPRSDVLPNMGKTEQPHPKPQQKYLLNPSSKTDEPIYYPDSGPRRWFKGQHPNYPSDGQVASYPAHPIDDKKSGVRPRQDIGSNGEKFSIPEQSYPNPQQKYLQLPSSDIDEQTILNYLEIRPQERYTEQYPEIPINGQLPGSSKLPVDGSEPIIRPQPVFVVETQKLDIPNGPDINHHRGYPHYPSSDTEYPEEYPDQSPQLYKGQQPQFQSKGPISLRLRPETGSEIEKLIPEKHPSKPQKKYPEYPSSYSDEGNHQHSSGLKRPKSSEIQYPKSDDQDYLDPQPMYPGQQPRFSSDDHVPDQLYPQHTTSAGSLPIQPRPNVHAQTGRLYITENPPLGEIEKFPQYPSIDTDNYTGPLGAIQNPQHLDQQPQFPSESSVPIGYSNLYHGKEPLIKARPDVLSQIGKFDVPIWVSSQYPSSGSGEPNKPYQPGQKTPLLYGMEIPVPTDYLGQSPLQYPSSTSKRSWMSPDNDSQTNRFEVPRSTGRVAKPQYPDLKQSSSADQFSKQVPQLLYDIAAPTDQPQQEFPQYPSSDDIRIPERPDIVSQSEVFKIPETPDLKPQQKGGQFLESFPSLSASTSSPHKPRTSMRAFEPEKQIYPKEENVPPISDILGNAEIFKVPEGPQFSPGQEHPQYFPKKGKLSTPETQSVPVLDLTPPNDIDINTGRLTIPSKIPWQPGARYSQYPSTDTQKPGKYPETNSGSRSQMQMTPDHHLPIGGDVLPENSDYYSSRYPAIYVMSQPHLTGEANILGTPGQPNLLPTQIHPQYPSTDPPDNGPSQIYSLADQQLPMKQLQRNIEMRMEPLDVTEPNVPVQVDEKFQNLYTTTIQTPKYSTQYYPDSSSLPLMIPSGSQPVHGYPPDDPQQPNIGHTTFYPDDSEQQHYTLDQSKHPHGQPPGYPSGSSPGKSSAGEQIPNLHHTVYPSGRQEQTTSGSTAPYYSSEPLPQHRPQQLHTIREKLPAYVSDSPDDNTDHVEPQGSPSTISPVDEGPKHLKKPTVYVYPLPRQPGVPPTESYGHKLDRRLPGTLQDVPKDLSTSFQGHLQPSGSFLPGTIEHHEPIRQTTPVEGYVVETASEPSFQVQYTTLSYPESVPRQSVVSPMSPVEPILYVEPSAEKVTLSSTLAYPDESNESATAGTSEQITVRPGPDDRTPQAPQSLHDFPRTELTSGQSSNPERSQPVGEPRTPSGDSSSVNTLDFPHSTEGAVNDRKPVSGGFNTFPASDLEGGFYPDEALTTTSQTTGKGSAPDEPLVVLSTKVPQLFPTGKPLLGEPSSGLTDVSPQSPTSFEPGESPVSPDSPQIPIGPSLVSDSKITRIYPVTKPTFYNDKKGQQFVNLKLLNDPKPTSLTGDIISPELNDSTQHPGTTDLIIPIGRNFSDMSTPSLPQNATQPHPTLKGIPIRNIQVFDAQKIIKIIESCNCSNLKFLIPILKRPQSAIVVANNEYPSIEN